MVVYVINVNVYKVGAKRLGYGELYFCVLASGFPAYGVAADEVVKTPVGYEETEGSLVFGVDVGNGFFAISLRSRRRRKGSFLRLLEGLLSSC